MSSSSPSSSPLTKRSRTLSDPSDSDIEFRRSTSPHSSPITKGSRSDPSDSEDDFGRNDSRVRDSAGSNPFSDSEDETLVVKKKKKFRDEMNLLETLKQNLELRNEIKKVQGKYSQLLSVLGDRVECPVCLDVPREGPVYICPNGHLICKSCKGKQCPTCREVMTENKSLLAVTVIENIEHKCKFIKCEETIAFDKIEDHKKVCEYRPVRWWPEKCKGGSMSLNDLRCHLSDSKKNCHSIQSLKTDDEDGDDVGCGTFKVKSADFFKAKNWKVHVFRRSLFEDEDVLFVLQPSRVDGCLRVDLVMLGTKDQCSEYRAQLSIHSAGSTPQNADKMFTFVGTPCSIDVFKPEEGFMPSQLIVSDVAIGTLLTKTNDNDVFNITLSVKRKDD